MTPGRSRTSSGIALALFLATVVAFLRPPLIPDIGAEFDLSVLALGGLASAFAFGRLVADVPVGRATDRYRSGPMMATGALVIGIGTLAMGLAPSAPLLLVASFVLGIGSAWILATSLAHFANAPRERRGTSLSLFAGSLLTGQAVGPAAAGAFAVLWGWRGVLVGGAGLALVVALGIRTVGSGVGPTANDTASSPAEGPPPIPRRVLAAVYLLPGAQFAIGAAVIQTLIPIIADESLAYSSAVIGLAIGLGGLARLLSAIVTGQVSDRVSRRAALVPGLALQLVGLLVLLGSASVIAWWTSILFLTLGSTAVNVGSTILADLSEGQRLGNRLGMFRLSGDAAFLVAPVLTGALFDAGGRVPALVPMTVFAAIVLAGAIFVIPETHRA